VNPARLLGRIHAAQLLDQYVHQKKTKYVNESTLMWDLAERDQPFCVAELVRAHPRKYLTMAEGKYI